MSRPLTNSDRASQNARRRKAWDKQAESFDKRIGWFERRVLGEDNRAWVCRRAKRSVLEVAIGTGLNLPLYESTVHLTGIDLSSAMLAIAQKRASDLGLEADLREADAHELPFDDDSFDSVVCTYSLCNIPDINRAIAEMNRVLKTGGTLLLVDHIRSETSPVLWIQKLIELFSLRLEGDYMTRRPYDQVISHGFEIVERDRFRFGGIVERLAALKPSAP